MSEMVSRVARALAQLEGHENLPTLQSAYEQRARVAIEAMRNEFAKIAEDYAAESWGNAAEEHAGEQIAQLIREHAQ